jgi:hypothetical protein
MRQRQLQALLQGLVTCAVASTEQRRAQVAQCVRLSAVLADGARQLQGALAELECLAVPAAVHRQQCAPVVGHRQLGAIRLRFEQADRLADGIVRLVAERAVVLRHEAQGTRLAGGIAQLPAAFGCQLP